MFMQEPVISVIVPIYNVEKYLNRCVQSIVDQTYKNLEIILVDDGSPDHCPQMCDAWAKKDSRIQVIHKKNAGVSSARNAGLDLSKGDYIAFTDGDDWMDDSMIAYLLNNAKLFGSDVTRCSYYTAKNEASYPLDWSVEPCLLSREERITDLFKNGYLSGSVWNKLYRRKSIGGIRFKTNVAMCEDLLFNYEIYDQDIKLLITSECKYHYFIREDSAMNSKFVLSSEDYLDVKQYILEREKNNSEIYLELLKQFILSAFTVVSCAARETTDSKYFWNSREKILKYKKQILCHGSFGIRERIKALILWIFPNLYKMIIKK